MTSLRLSNTGDARKVDQPHRATRQGWLKPIGTVVVGYAIISALLIAAGLVVVGPLKNTALIAWDERTVRWFAEHRTDLQNSVSLMWSKLADAPSIVGVGVLSAIVLAIRGRWRQIGCLAALLVVELGTFLTISYTVGRKRPTVAHLGSVPSTGSFPSGHIAATIVLYGFIAVLVWRSAAPHILQVLAVVWVVVAALAVGWARVYRGMHHPLDVLAGAAMGIGLLFVFTTAFASVVWSQERNRS